MKTVSKETRYCTRCSQIGFPLGAQFINYFCITLFANNIKNDIGDVCSTDDFLLILLILLILLYFADLADFADVAEKLTKYCFQISYSKHFISLKWGMR